MTARPGRIPPFGIVPTLFWESDECRAIQQHGGKDGLVLSSYLRANRSANMLGLYRLVVGDVLRDLPVLGTVDAALAAFRGLRAARWADYDESTAFVWVRSMALERLQLSSGKVLDPEDNRRRGAQRLYESLPPNPFLEPFFDAYGHTLRLQRRTFAQPTLYESAPREGASEGGCEAPYEGARQAPPSGTSTYDPDLLIREDQDRSNDQQERTAPLRAARIPFLDSTRRETVTKAPNGSNYHVIARVARELLADRALAEKYLEDGIESEQDLVEATKRCCAKKKIDYGRHDGVPFDVVHRACASEWFKFRNPGIARQVASSPRPDRSGTA